MITILPEYTRRGITAVAVALAIMAAVGSIALTSAAPEAAAAPTIKGPAWTSSALNLREGPSIEEKIITTMPARSKVVIRGAARHGFYPVTYVPETGKRVRGFAHGDSIARWAVAKDDVNLRSGPGTNNDIRTVIKKGARVVVVGLPRNGFYPVTYPFEHGFLQGWSAKEYLRWGVGDPLEAGIN